MIRKSAKPLGGLFIGLLGVAVAVYFIEQQQLEAHLDAQARVAAGEDVPVPAAPTITTYDEAVWWCVVTASTVGYGDFYPVSDAARILGGVFILFTVGFLTTILGHVQGAVIEANRLRELGMNGTTFDAHLIVCGWSQIARVAVTELLAAGKRVAVVVPHADDIPGARELGADDRLFVTVGDPTAHPVLERCNLSKASTIIAATEDDTNNLIISLNMRAAHPSARIIVYVQRDELRHTLSASGVTYVASPFEMSGRLVASAAFEPEVAVFVDQVTSGTDGHDLQQFTVTSGSRAHGQTVQQVRRELDEADAALIVAIGEAKAGDRWDVRPHPENAYTFKDGDVLVVVGTDKQNDKVAALLGVRQGR